MGGRGGFHWPASLDQDDDSLAAYMAMFREAGFTECPDGELEPGTEKVCLYVADGEFTHVAVQLDNGWWSSKLGQGNDISHQELDSLCAGRPDPYGDTFVYMSRARDGASRPVSGLLLPT